MSRSLDAKVRPLVVASQLGEKLNAQIAARVEGLTLFEIPRGYLTESASTAEVVFAWPLEGDELYEHSEPPPGWPGKIAWIQLITAGADAYPRWIFDGPVVTCARGPSATPLAEFALAAILAAAKHLPDHLVRSAAEWDEKKLFTSDIVGSTLGLIGFGASGRRLAECAVALGMRVMATRRTAAPFEVAGVLRAESIGDLLSQSDHVVLAAPATAETWHIINRETLARAKPGLHLINIARGSLIDDEALLEALAAEKVGLASLDVTEPEPLPPGHPFYAHPRIHLSSHISMYTPRGFEGLVDKIVDNIARYRQGLPLLDIVDIARGY